jgi:hypothetical protein
VPGYECVITIKIEVQEQQEDTDRPDERYYPAKSCMTVACCHKIIFNDLYNVLPGLCEPAALRKKYQRFPW